MRLPLTTSRLASFSARHPWIVIGIWLVLLVAAAVGAPGLKTALGGAEMKFLNNPDSIKGEAVLAQKLSNIPTANASSTESVLVHSDTLTVNDAQFKQVVNNVTSGLVAKTGLVSQAYNYYQIAILSPDSAGGLVSTDKHTAMVVVVLKGTSSQIQDNIPAYLEAVNAQAAKGYTVATIGESSITHEYSTVAEQDLVKAEMYGIPITLIVLVFVFGAVLAAGVSLGLALVAIFVSIGCISLIGYFYPQSYFIVNVIMMIGLAVGIDYALFIIERYREERRQGLSKIDAIIDTGATASKAVLFSGGTVMLALVGLFIVPISTFRSLGLGALLVVASAVMAMLTLVPAILSVIGDRVNWPLVRWHRRKHTGEQVHHAGTVYTGFWGMFTKSIMKRPRLGVILTVIVLLGLAVPALYLKTGASGQPDSLPNGPRRDAYQLLVKNFPSGVLSPVQIVVDAKESAQVDSAIKKLQAGIKSSGDFLGGSTVIWSQNKDAALISASLSVGAYSDKAYSEIDTLRTKTIPGAFSSLTGVRVHVTGQTALNKDSLNLVNTLTPVVLAFVLALTFILLMIVFHSIIVPICAILMNALSVAAAYGLLVVVFQWGVGHQLFGFKQTSTIESWVPIFLFCILFGLSMDYHVFLLSRIREYYDQTNKSREAVAIGLKATSRIITGAALIMVVVFSTFAAGNLVMLQQVGFGLAVAVLLDATLIRSILVPASMTLLGKISWYLPRVLKRILPRIHLEGKRGKAVRHQG